MKPMLIVAMLTGLFIPLNGQPQWCFSKNCPETRATSFRLDRRDKQLNKIFRTVPTLPAYKPVVPLALSPSTFQFFHYSAPTGADYPLGLGDFRNAPALSETSHGGTLKTYSPASPNSSGPTFSTGQGGIVFNPASPKF